MGDKVFVEGRAAVHKGSNGRSIAFPDVCLCPPAPPAGPVPIPLTNTVVPADLEGGACTVLIEDNPAGMRSSFFKKSTGNEVSISTGGGLMSHGVQGMAHFQTFSMRVFFEGEPAVRHLDLLTHNHIAQPPNTPPSPWLSTMAVSPVVPSTIVRRAGDGPDSLEIQYQDRGAGRRRPPPLRYVVKVSDGRRIEGHAPVGGVVVVTGLPKGGRHVIEFPDRLKRDGRGSR